MSVVVGMDNFKINKALILQILMQVLKFTTIRSSIDIHILQYGLLDRALGWDSGDLASRFDSSFDIY